MDITTYKNLLTCKSIIPSLSVAVKCAISENLDVFAPPLPESDRLLEWVVEVVVLPVGYVVRELQKSTSSQIFQIANCVPVSRLQVELRCC